MVRGLKIASKKTDRCISCVMGKQCKVPHPSTGRIVAHEDATIVHFDTFDATQMSLGRNYYMVVAIDEYSNYRFAIC